MQFQTPGASNFHVPLPTINIAIPASPLLFQNPSILHLLPPLSPGVLDAASLCMGDPEGLSPGETNFELWCKIAIIEVWI